MVILALTSIILNLSVLKIGGLRSHHLRKWYLFLLQVNRGVAPRQHTIDSDTLRLPETLGHAEMKNQMPKEFRIPDFT